MPVSASKNRNRHTNSAVPGLSLLLVSVSSSDTSIVAYAATPRAMMWLVMLTMCP
jgi:hypothetical protein